MTSSHFVIVHWFQKTISNNSGLPPKSKPLKSLSGAHTNSAKRVNVKLCALKMQALGVFLLQNGKIKGPLMAKLIVSLYFSRITPSFNKSLLRLVGAEYHNITHLYDARDINVINQCLKNWEFLHYQGGIE